MLSRTVPLTPEAASLLPTRGDSGRPLSLLSGLVPTAPFALTVGSLKFKLGHPRHRDARPTHLRLSARAALALALAGSDSCQCHCGGAQAQQAAPGSRA